jgi:hypothetical protein
MNMETLLIKRKEFFETRIQGKESMWQALKSAIDTCKQIHSHICIE